MRNYATKKQRREIDNLSELSAYAYGFSDKKPGWSYWIILIAMVLFVLMSAGAHSQALLEQGSFPPHAGRPDPRLWVAVANAGDPDEIWHYRVNARKLHLTIFVGYPTPCDAGAAYAARIGMRGIYVLRSQAAHLGFYDLNPW